MPKDYARKYIFVFIQPFPSQHPGKDLHTLASFKLNFSMTHSNDTTNFNNQNNITFKVTFGGFTVT